MYFTEITYNHLTAITDSVSSAVSRTVLVQSITFQGRIGQRSIFEISERGMRLWGESDVIVIFCNTLTHVLTRVNLKMTEVR